MDKHKITYFLESWSKIASNFKEYFSLKHGIEEKEGTFVSLAVWYRSTRES